MSDKPMTLEDLARAEAQILKEREKTRIALADAQKRLVTEMPERFITLARQIRDGVRRFNETAYKEIGPDTRLVKYEESVAVTTRDSNLGSDFHIQIQRDRNQLWLGLRSMWRPNRPDYYIIEGQGTVARGPGVGGPGEERRFTLRIDGLSRSDGEIFYRATCEGEPIDTPTEELGERMVMVIITGELSRLWNRPPWVDVK